MVHAEADLFFSVVVAGDTLSGFCTKPAVLVVTVIFQNKTAFRVFRKTTL